MGGIFVSKYTLTFPGHSFQNRRLGESKLIPIQLFKYNYTVLKYISKVNVWQCKNLRAKTREDPEKSVEPSSSFNYISTTS